MAFLTIDGDLDLQVTDATEQEPELQGDEARSDSGQLRGAITDEKRRFSLTLLEMEEADLADLRSRIALGAHVSATGDAVGGVTLTVRGYLRDAGYVRVPGGGFLRSVRLDLVEV